MMTPFEIKEFYGIDITTNKRDKLFIYLRAIYAKENIKKISVVEIAKNIKKNRTTVLHILKSYKNYKTDVYFKLISECYQNKDKSLLQKSNKFLQAKINEKNDFAALRIKIKILSKPNIITIRKQKTGKINKKPPILEVAKNLRTKRVYLNDKVYTEWNNEDFNYYEQIIQTQNNSCSR